MEAPNNDVLLEDWERGTPLPRLFGKELPWWLALMIFGDSSPIDEQKLLETKRAWREEDAEGAVSDIRERFKELQSSTLDNFVRLTIVGAVVAAIVALGQQIAPFITGKKTPLPTVVASWVFVVCTGLAIIAILMMVIPKYKEWRRFTAETRDSVGMQVLNGRKNRWREFVRLQHRYAHRIQLITFERRVKHVGCVTAMLGYLAWAVALHFA